VEKCCEEIVLMTTLPSRDVALSLVRALVEERLVACGTALPEAISQYYWQGELCRDEETVVLLKTTRQRLPEIESRFASLHPYEVPEMLTFVADQISPSYRDWMRKEMKARSGE
jgi:periplasmic divalent cation tolerance protein